MNLNVTYKDGQIMASRNKATLKDPMSIKDVEKKFDGRGEIKTAFVKSLKDLQNAFKTLDQTDLNKFFANGQNFMSIEIVYPSTRNVVHYGNRCLIVLHGLNVFDDKGRRVTQDKQSASELFKKLQANDALKQKTFEITSPIVLKLKNIKDVASALEDILADLDKIVDGIGYKATVNDYVKERYAKYIVNCALKKGIDLYRNSDFVNELIARLSYVADHRPNRADLVTYAKRDGVNWKAPEYKELIDWLESTADETNDAIIKPVEELVLKAGILIMKCLLGIVAVDPRHSVRKMLPELNATIAEMEKYNEGLTPEKIKIFRRCMKNLDNYQAGLPEDGILILYNGKVCKIKGIFGAINNIVKLMNY